MPSTFTNGNTADYINQLKTDKHTLVTNLVAKGVTSASDSETFTTLVAKVNDISGGGFTEKSIAFPVLQGGNESSDTIHGGGISYSDLLTFLGNADKTAIEFIGSIFLTDRASQTITSFTLPGTWTALRGFRSFQDILKISTLTQLDLSGIGTLLPPLNQQSIDTSNLYQNPKTVSLQHMDYYARPTSALAVTTIDLSGLNVTASIDVGGTMYYGGNFNALFDLSYYDQQSYSQVGCFTNVTSIDMSNMDFDKLYLQNGSMGSQGMNDVIFCEYDHNSSIYKTRFSNNGCTIYVKNSTQQTWVQNCLNGHNVGTHFNVVVR